MTKIVLRPSGPQSAPRPITTSLTSRFHKSNVERNYHELDKRLQSSPDPPSDQGHPVADPLSPVPSDSAPAESDKAVADQFNDEPLTSPLKLPPEIAATNARLSGSNPLSPAGLEARRKRLLYDW